MSEIVKIETHADDAEGRLPEQYKGLPKMVALTRIFGDQAQELEDAFYDILTKGSLSLAFGVLLDQIGDIVDQPRNGLDDASYKVRLIAKIGQNVSNGTAEELVFIYQTLMQADRVYYNPLYPASASLTAIGVDPVGTADEIRAALDLSHVGGVSLDYLASVDAISFSFFGDPDPNGEGFGDSTDAAVGGTLATLI